MLGQTLWIIVGLPGSGKSTLANKISNEDPMHPLYFEADMYFINNAGKYNWRGCDLGKAHHWCYNKVENELKAGKSVIVSNTNLTKKERKPYIDLGKSYGAEVKVIVCKENYGNIHNVPEESIIKMKNKFQDFDNSELN